MDPLLRHYLDYLLRRLSVAALWVLFAAVVLSPLVLAFAAGRCSA